MLRTMGAILLAFPLLDIGVTYVAAQMLGSWLWIWLLLAAIAGVLLIRRNARVLMREFATALQRGEAPLVSVMAGMKMGLAGLLLLMPGILSDLLALVLLMWTPAVKPVVVAASGVYEGEFSRVTPADRTLRP